MRPAVLFALLALLSILTATTATPPSVLLRRRLRAQEVDEMTLTTLLPVVTASVAGPPDNVTPFPLPVAIILGLLAVLGVVGAAVYVVRTARSDAMRKSDTECTTVLHMDGFLGM
ncbi:hypothetical protein H257_18086 [Aphanomyces astaci]|uniref:Uncharacterized protein n=1 Tax=Aphanomyces astaci TaxID=112090 RepID=W4FCE3_APHAT|nr:hypothetical protein H257_18086 [Aphanomyces astaci]ETV65130.1 hypothetical protein H257_18086 [Aphanomyces astaci]RQM22028.1 hypothetical protein B5M09_009179 [Aphanomyces astaci]|eukprot:XP_009845399.1 hypothetical protein H257_18086 [Aphanomyces astaci]